MCSRVNERKVHFFLLSNRVASIQTWKHYDFLAVIAHKHTLIPTNTFRFRDISQAVWLWVFSSFSFLFSIFITLSPLVLFLSLFLPYCFSSSLSFIQFLIQAPCLSSAFTLSHRALCLLPQASCVYISVVYFYKCQTAFLPSVYWSTERRRERWENRRTETKSRGGTERRNETEGEKKAGWKMWRWGLICTLFCLSLFSISIPPYCPL